MSDDTFGDEFNLESDGDDSLEQVSLIPGLGDLAPEPGPGYWTSIDARLEAIETKRTQPSSSSQAEDFNADRDTSPDLIRLDDMRANEITSTSKQRVLLSVAASLIFVAGASAIILAFNRNSPEPVGTDTAKESVTTTSTFAHSTVGENVEQPGPLDTPDSVDPDPVDSGPVAIPDSTTCWVGVGSTIVIDTDGAGDIRSAGIYEDGTEITAVGRFIDDAGYWAFMNIDDPSGTSRARPWSIGNVLALPRERAHHMLREVACDEVAEATELYKTLKRLEPKRDGFEPVLAEGTTTCWTVDFDRQTAALYEIRVGSDGIAELTEYEHLKSATTHPVITRIKRGTGSFFAEDGVIFESTVVNVLSSEDPAGFATEDIYFVELRRSGLTGSAGS